MAGYQRLTSAEVKADLPFLDRAELSLVRTLEEAGGRRPDVLAGIDELLAALPEGSAGWNAAGLAASRTGWSAQELHDQLDALGARDPSSAGPLLALPETPEPRPSRWRWARVVAGVAIVAVIFIVAATVLRHSQGSAAPAGGPAGPLVVANAVGPDGAPREWPSDPQRQIVVRVHQLGSVAPATARYRLL